MNFTFGFIILLLLANCSEKEEVVTNPAGSQIEQYNKTLEEECGKDSQSAKTKSTQNLDNKVDANNMEKKLGPIGTLEINEHDIVLGDKNSKVVVIEYIAPTCPHCAYYHKEILPKLQEQYIKTNKIAYVIRNFIANKLDLDASVLAYCAKDQELFLKFTNIILQQQESWSLSNKYREILTNIAGLGGISAEKYASCLQDNELLEFIWQNSQAATKSPKFVGTPAFFINNIQFSGPYSIVAFIEAIDKAISTAAEIKTE